MSESSKKYYPKKKRNCGFIGFSKLNQSERAVKIASLLLHPVSILVSVIFVVMSIKEPVKLAVHVVVIVILSFAAIVNLVTGKRGMRFALICEIFTIMLRVDVIHFTNSLSVLDGVPLSFSVVIVPIGLFFFDSMWYNLLFGTAFYINLIVASIIDFILSDMDSLVENIKSMYLNKSITAYLSIGTPAIGIFCYYFVTERQKRKHLKHVTNITQSIIDLDLFNDKMKKFQKKSKFKSTTLEIQLQMILKNVISYTKFLPQSVVMQKRLEYNSKSKNSRASRRSKGTSGSTGTPAGDISDSDVFEFEGDSDDNSLTSSIESTMEESNYGKIQIGLKQRKITIFAMRIENFFTLLHKVDKNGFMKIHGIILDYIVELATRFNGICDFDGAFIYITWNGVRRTVNHQKRACECALEAIKLFGSDELWKSKILEKISGIDEKENLELLMNQISFYTTCAIFSQSCFCGNVGGNKGLQKFQIYTSVEGYKQRSKNLCERYKTNSSRIIITKSVHSEIRLMFKTKLIDVVKAKKQERNPKKQHTFVYKLISKNNFNTNQEWMYTLAEAGDFDKEGGEGTEWLEKAWNFYRLNNEMKARDILNTHLKEDEDAVYLKNVLEKKEPLSLPMFRKRKKRSSHDDLRKKVLLENHCKSKSLES